MGLRAMEGRLSAEQLDLPTMAGRRFHDLRSFVAELASNRQDAAIVEVAVDPLTVRRLLPAQHGGQAVAVAR